MAIYCVLFMCGNNYFINCAKYLALTWWGVLLLYTARPKQTIFNKTPAQRLA